MKEEWKIKQINTFSKIMYGHTAKSSLDFSGPKYLRITDIQDDNVCWDDVPNCRGFEEVEKFRLQSNDIVFARTGATTGKSFLLNNPPKAVFASYLIRLQILEDNVLPEYVYKFFQSADYWNIINAGISGSAQGGFNAKKLGAMQIPIPPLAEQKQIVSILDKAFASIDQAKANIEKNIQNAEELFQSKLNQIFSQKREGWEDKKLGDICENLDRKRKPITKGKRKSGPYPYYGASGIVDYVEGYLFDEELLLVSEDGANLLARTYPIAFSASDKIWVNNHAHVLKFKNRKSQLFVEFYLNSISLAPWVSGMAQPKLNQRMLNSIPVPYPSLFEQESLVNTLIELKISKENVTNNYNKKVESLEELKKSLLQKAFTGELTKDFNAEEIRTQMAAEPNASYHEN